MAKLNFEDDEDREGDRERARHSELTITILQNVHPEKCILKYAILCMYNDTPKIVICKWGTSLHG